MCKLTKAKKRYSTRISDRIATKRNRTESGYYFHGMGLYSWNLDHIILRMLHYFCHGYNLDQRMCTIYSNLK